MDSSRTCGSWRPCLLHHSNQHHRLHHHHHPLFLCPLPLPHHHHHRISPHCPLHSYLLQPNSHPHACPNSLPLPSQSKLQVPGTGETYPSDPLMMQEEGYEGVVEEDEEEPVFVLTDEWKEFFAKSEAKRRLAKKQARKKGKV